MCERARLLIARSLHVTPLINIHNAAFAQYHCDGLWWSLYGDYEGDKPLPDHYFVENIKRDASKGAFSGLHDDLLYHLGFYFGMVHGGILDPRTGQIRPDVIALVTLTHCDTKRGYPIGRRDCFMNLAPESRIFTDAELLEELRETALDLMDSADDPECIRLIRERYIW
jgi:hypothetical protein